MPRWKRSTPIRRSICSTSAAWTAAAAETLEAYVQGGGGLAIFAGPDVNTGYYNQALYKEGKGILPAPLGMDTDARRPRSIPASRTWS